VFGGSTNTKFNEFLCKYPCRLSFRCLQIRRIPIQRPGGSAGGTCRCAPHPPPQVLSILGTLAIQISTNKRRRLGFVDELVNRNFLCTAHSVAGNAKYVTSAKYVRFVTQSFTKMSRKSNSSLASIFASYPHCDACSISPCGNEVFGGSTNTKFNEFLCNSNDCPRRWVHWRTRLSEVRDGVLFGTL